MVSVNEVFNCFPSHPGVPFFCRVVDKDGGFEIELFNKATEQAWACTVTMDNLELCTDVATRIPLDNVKSFVKIGLVALGTGCDCANVTLDMTDHTEELAVLQLRLRFGMGNCYWTPNLKFMLEQVDAERREKIELQATIAAMASQLNTKPEPIGSVSDQGRSVRQAKANSLLCSFFMMALTLFVVAATNSIAIQTPPARAIAFASVKPSAIRAHSKVIFWEPSGNLDEKFFSANHARVKIAEPGFVQVSIMLRHSNCRSDIAFKVYLGKSEIASVYDYTCGLLSIGISTTYVHTIAVEANDTLSVKYIGGGTLYMEDSFMDVLLLPSTSK